MPKGQAGSLPAAGSLQPWSGPAVAKARQWLAEHTAWPTPCGRCRRPVNLDDPWSLGHVQARSTHPHLTWAPSNWQVEHRKCSDSSGQAQVIEKAKAEALREAGIGPGFSPGVGHGQAPPLFPSLAKSSKAGPTWTRAELTWSEEYLNQFDWLQPLTTVPEDAAVPLMMSPVPADAVGSYGWDAIAWIESTQKIRLRWWQKLSLVRQLEHRADGSLCFKTKIESAPRRAGKSVGLRGQALWRLQHGQRLFGEPQTVIHTGSDMNICREIQRQAWRWAEAQEWIVTRGNGKECVANGDDRWLVRAQDAVYGYDLHLGMVDEAWAVKPDTVAEGLEPAMLERSSPQLVLTSTAHRRATSLMRTYLATAMSGDDPAMLLLLWGAPAGADPGDPRVWKAASPHWSEDRRQMIASKYEKALAGQDDPEFDDPDPIKGFMAQFLNVWTITEPKSVGRPVVSPEEWDALATSVPGTVPDSVGVEAWFADGVAVAEAWKPADGPVVVRVTDHPDLPSAAAYVASRAPRRPVLVGTSLAEHSAWREHRLRVAKVGNATRASVAELTRFLAEGKFLHDGSATLTDQVVQLRTSPGVDGPRIRSTGRADAIKAATWAVQEASVARPAGMTLPSRFARV